MCVGPRSAVFAPLTDVGLIVVDEEHDGSYKQEGDPRYDARHVAERRARACGAVLLAGSATPRPESVARHERLVGCDERVDGSGAAARRAGGHGRTCRVRCTPRPGRRSTRCAGAARRRSCCSTAAAGRTSWPAGECGRVWELPGLRRDARAAPRPGRVSCHHCGHSERVPDRCPDCGSVSVSRHGLGTEQLGSELETLVAPLPVFRLDADTVASDGIPR